jgi:hypothetical protein
VDKVEKATIDTTDVPLYKIISGPRTAGTYGVFFPASVSSYKYVIGLPQFQIAYNKAKVDSVKMVRFGTDQYSVQYSTVDGLGGLSQPIIPMGIYDVSLKINGTWVVLERQLSKIVGTFYQYKPSGVNLLYSTNSYNFVKVSKTTAASQSYFNWFFGMNRNRFQYSIERGSVTTNEYLNGPAYAGGFVFNHLM